MHNHLHYANKTDRDEEYKRLKEEGIAAKRSTSTNLVLSPDYVIGHNREDVAPNGFGGAAPTFWAKVYNLDIEY